MLNKLKRRVAGWWEGTPIEDKDYGVIGYRRGWLSRAAHSVKNFILNDWRWAITTATALVAAVAAVIAALPRP